MSFRVMTYNILDDGAGREPMILEVVQFVLRELPAVEMASDHYPVVAEFDF